MSFSSDDDDAWDLGYCRDQTFDEDNERWVDPADDYIPEDDIDYYDEWHCDSDEGEQCGYDDEFLNVDWLTDRLASAHLDRADTSTTIVYRAAIVGQAWDRIERHKSLTDPRVKFRMRARSTNGIRSTSTLEQHIRMGWDNSTCSSYVSFTTDPNWAAYYTLMREFVGGQVRKLYRLEVPTAQLMSYGGGDSLCKAFTKTASEVFGHRSVDVYDYVEQCVDDKVRKSSMVWFAQRKKYPFAEWLADN